MEGIDGDELLRWRHHFSKIPFTTDMIDILCIKVCRLLAMGLLQKTPQWAEQGTIPRDVDALKKQWTRRL